MEKIKLFCISCLTFASLLSMLSCSGDKVKQHEVKFKLLDNVSDDKWEAFSQKIFYFGHQSIGWNILKGIDEIKKEYPKINLQIIESTNPEDLAPGTLAHSNIGENTKPITKIDSFTHHLLDQGIGPKIDAAALKLCYVDIMSNSEPEVIFAKYQDSVKQIMEAQRNLTIIHFTSPLTTLQKGPKAWVKKLIGRPVYGVRENINRHRYNELLRAEYKGKEPILDIAKIESTHLDGSRETFKTNGDIYYSMAPEYTFDGGHLNELGRKKVAEQLIFLLVNL